MILVGVRPGRTMVSNSKCSVAYSQGLNSCSHSVFLEGPLFILVILTPGCSKLVEQLSGTLLATIAEGKNAPEGL